MKIIIGIIIIYIAGGFLYWAMLTLLEKSDEKERQKKRQKDLMQKHQYERYMWDNYNLLCENWNSILKKGVSYLVSSENPQITNATISFLADFKSNCALWVAGGKCNCNRQCKNCEQYDTNTNCVFQCKNSCLACVQFRKYANCYVQLSEYNQMEVDQLAMKIFRQYIAKGIPPGTEL